MDFFFVTTVVTGMLEAILTGALLGWPSLQYILKQEKYLYYLCNSSYENGSTTNATVSLTCPEQLNQFSLIFTLVISSQQILILPAGYILDYYGTRIYRIICSFFFTVSLILLTLSTAGLSWLVYPALILEGCFGGLLFVSNLQIANIVPSCRGTVVALLSGSMDFGAGIFLLIKFCYDLGYSLRSMLYVFLTLSSLPWIRTFLLMPKKIIHVDFWKSSSKMAYGYKEWKCFKKEMDVAKNQTENSHSGHDKQIRQNQCTESGPCSESGSVINVSSFTVHLKNILLWTYIFYSSVIICRVVFFLNSFLEWIDVVEDDFKNVNKLTNIFSILLLLPAFLAPLHGVLVDTCMKLLKNCVTQRRKLEFYSLFCSMTVTSAFSILLSLAAIIPNAYLSFAFFVLSKSFIFAASPAFLIITFPIQHFGKLYGVTNIIIALFCLIQIGLSKLSTTVDPHFQYINIGFLILMAFSLIHPIAVLIQAKKAATVDDNADENTCTTQL